MAESIQLKREFQLRRAEDYNFLRATAIARIQELSGDCWTDYNPHDPGITLLEAICFALTDLGYRSGFPIGDLLARQDAGDDDLQDIFPAIDQVLPCSPVTTADYRKLVADIDGVRNAWVEQSDEYEIPIYIGYEGQRPHLRYEADQSAAILPLKGLYRVLVELEEDVVAEGREEAVFREIRQTLHRHRNLCEDFVTVSAVEHEMFTLTAEIEVREGADIDRVAARIYQIIHDLFSPAVNFYSIDQLKQKGYAIADIFSGPLLRHGFIDDAQIRATSYLQSVQLSDIVSLIMDIEDVIAIGKLAIPADTGAAFPNISAWLEHMQDQQRMPKLDVGGSTIRFTRSGDRHRDKNDKKADLSRVRYILDFLLAGSRKLRLKNYERTPAIPSGEFQDPGVYYPFQRSLPNCYGMEEQLLEDGGTAPATGTAIEERLASIGAEQRRVLQLRGFLMPFELLLANFLSQLAHIRDLYTLDSKVVHTLYQQVPEGIKDIEALFIDLAAYKQVATTLLEDDDAAAHHRSRLLDHLLSRFGESVNSDLHEPGNGLLQSGSGLPDHDSGLPDHGSGLPDPASGFGSLAHKAAFLHEAAPLSRDRSKGFDYRQTAGSWNTGNVAGCKKRIARLLGLQDCRRTSIASAELYIHEVLHGQELKRWVVQLRDPLDTERLLLQSVEYETRGEAEVTLNYLLEQGMDSHNWIKHGREEELLYHLKRDAADGDRETVAYTHTHSRGAADGIRDRVIQVLQSFSRDENFHLLEHILLRPRINSRGKATPKKGALIDKESVYLLPVTEAATPPAASPTAIPERTPYRFNMTRVKGPEKKDGWRLNFLDAGAQEVFFAPLFFPIYKQVTRRIEHLRQCGADRGNYHIEPIHDKHFRFTIRSNDQIIAEGTKKYQEEEAAEMEVDRLVRFFSFDRSAPAKGTWDEASDETAGLDPYSFHITVVIPSWPARFRDPGFRHLLEMTLFQEIPAHIYPDVYWVGHQEMHRFEAAYRLWLTDQCQAEIPNTEVLNNLLYQLEVLKNTRE